MVKGRDGFDRRISAPDSFLTGRAQTSPKHFCGETSRQFQRVLRINAMKAYIKLCSALLMAYSDKKRELSLKEVVYIAYSMSSVISQCNEYSVI